MQKHSDETKCQSPAGQQVKACAPEGLEGEASRGEGLGKHRGPRRTPGGSSLVPSSGTGPAPPTQLWNGAFSRGRMNPTQTRELCGQR